VGDHSGVIDARPALLLCGEKDPVWDRPCERIAGHERSPEAAQRLHCNEEPGDRIRWGEIRDMRTAERR
jgi:hypothetical protein